MSRIRMAVEIRNESDVPLVWQRDELESGEWTDPWYPSKGATVAPGTTTEWRAEGDLVVVPTSGTEGSVWYNVNGDANQQLYVHFNSPLIESEYDNTFHVWAPPGFEVAHWGGQGHEARLTIRFRRTAKQAVSGFLPSTNGFHFTNKWSAELPAMTVGLLQNKLLGGFPSDVAETLGLGAMDDNFLPLTQADTGLCGGMVFATMDYFIAHQAPPPDATAPTDVNNPLFIFIRNRLVDSFDILGSGHRWLAYTSPTYPNGDEGFIQAVGLARGRAWVTYRDEWPRIRDDIDGGNLSPLGLIQSDEMDIGKNHQVMAYAYQQDGQFVRLWIYDPNQPNEDDLRLEFDVTNTSAAVAVTREGYPAGSKEPEKHIFAIIRTNGYAPVPPPTRWHDPYAIAPPGHAASGAISAHSRAEDLIDVFWVGPDGGVGATWFTNAAGWAAPYAIAPPGNAAAGAVSAHSRAPDAIDVFWVGPDGGVGATWFNNASGWAAPYAIAPAGHAAAGAVSGHSRDKDQIDVFWVGPDGGVGATWFNTASGWAAPYAIAPPGSAAPGAISAHSRVADLIDVFWVGPDGGVGATWFTNAAGWAAPYAIAPPGNAAPGAITAHSRAPDQIDVFWIGPDGGVGATWFNNASGWAAPYAIAPPGHAAPGAITAHSRHPDHVDVFWIGPDGGVGGNWWNAAEGWHQPYPLALGGNAAAGAVTAHSRGPEIIDVFWIGPDGGVGANWWG